MEIMFDDLTYEAQERLLSLAGISSPEEMNWDSVPIAVVEFEDAVFEDDDEEVPDDIEDEEYDEEDDEEEDEEY